jgi:hypothetical protein
VDIHGYSLSLLIRDLLTASIHVVGEVRTIEVIDVAQRKIPQ